MRQEYFAIAALCLFAIVPAQADVVDVTVNGTVGGSGHVFASCSFSPDPFCNDLALISLSSANNQLGTVSVSGGGSASNGKSSLTTTVQQTTTASLENLSVDLHSATNVTSIGAQWGDHFAVNNSDSVTFSLTTQSWLQLTMQQTSETSGNVLTTFSSCVSLVGPFGFNSSWCPLGLPLPMIDQMFLLAPGSYTLNAHDGITNFFNPFVDLRTFPGEFSSALDAVSVNLDFTPIVPEPVWIAIFPALLVIAWHRAWLRQRGRQRLPP